MNQQNIFEYGVKKSSSTGDSWKTDAMKKERSNNMMYEKNLTQDLRLRLSEDDMNFLRQLSCEREVSISSCLRGMIGEYRRGLAIINAAADAARKEQRVAVHGDTKTDIDDQLQQ